MEKLTVKEILPYISAKLIRGSEDTGFTGISIDSRVIEKGDLFFPFSGQNVDAHDFILEALKKGASCSLATREWPVPTDFPQDKCLLEVDSISEALQKLASYYRQRLNIPYIIGITGSNGKTTTKDLIASVVKEKFKTLKTKGNYNNEIGVPLTLFGLNKEHQVAVVELGMRGLGEIKELTDIVHPNLGVITNVGETHLEILGSKENIAQAKGELVEAIPPHGWVILNADDPLVAAMVKKADGSVLFYGLEKEAQIRASNVRSLGEQGMAFTLAVESEQIEIGLPLLGCHNVYNALAAAGVGRILGLSLPMIKNGLEKVELTGMRLEIIETAEGIKIINDTYNASPASMEGALKILGDISLERGGRSIAILGNMYELGEYTQEAHHSIGKLTAQLGVDFVITVGQLASQISQGAVEAGLDKEKILVCGSNQDALEKLPVLKKGDTVLVKGSRSMKMEEIVESFRDNSRR